MTKLIILAFFASSTVFAQTPGERFNGSAFQETFDPSILADSINYSLCSESLVTGPENNRLSPLSFQFKKVSETSFISVSNNPGNFGQAPLQNENTELVGTLKKDGSEATRLAF